MAETVQIPSHDLIAQAIAAGDSEQVLAAIDGVAPGELARALSRLSADQHAQMLSLLAPEDAARLLDTFEGRHAAEIMEQLPASDAAAIVDELPSNDSADLVAQLEPEAAQAVLSAMDPEAAEGVRVLSEYPPDVGGGLMVTEVLAYGHREKAGDVVADLRLHADEYADYLVQYIYVVKGDRRLVGVLRLRDLLLGRPENELRDVMIAEPVAVDHMADLNSITDLFDRHPFLGFPVVDDGRLVGLVRRTSVQEAIARRAANQFRLVQGIVGGEEFRTMPLFRRSARRLSWLSVNVVLNVIAASVIVLFEDTLARVIALAVFLPIISDMSGCSGNQAVAVSMRELNLGLLRPREIGRVWSKEVLVGIVNGLALGGLLALVAYLWKGNAYLGLVVGGALMLNTVVAVSIGGTVPLALKRLGFDPALASGPILTTVTDMCGFFLALGFATVMLQLL
jgi:magnesium transporter